MKYSKRTEKDSLILKFKSEKISKYLDDLEQVINFLVDNIDTFLNITKNSPLYKNLPKILEVAFGKDEAKFQEMCTKFLEHGSKYDLEDSTISLVQRSLTNMRSLVNGKIKEVLPNLSIFGLEDATIEDQRVFTKTVNSIVKDQYDRLQKGFEAAIEGDKSFGKLLHQKMMADREAIRHGKRLKLEEQEAYQFFKATTTPPFKSK